MISRILDAVSGIWDRMDHVTTIFYTLSPAPERKENIKGFFSFCPGLCLPPFIRQQNMLQHVCGSLSGGFFWLVVWGFCFGLVLVFSALSEICLVLTTVSTPQHLQLVNVVRTK